MGQNSESTVSIHHGDGGHVKFTDRDNHIFFIKMGKALEACRRAREFEIDLEHDEEELGTILWDWIKENGSSFADVVITSSAKGVQLYFASNTDAFDVSLSEKLADLESCAMDRLATVRLTTRQVSTAELHEIRELDKN